MPPRSAPCADPGPYLLLLPGPFARLRAAAQRGAGISNAFSLCARVSLQAGRSLGGRSPGKCSSIVRMPARERPASCHRDEYVKRSATGLNRDPERRTIGPHAGESKSQVQPVPLDAKVAVSSSPRRSFAKTCSDAQGSISRKALAQRLRTADGTDRTVWRAMARCPSSGEASRVP